MTYKLTTLNGLKRKMDIQLSAGQVKTAFDDSYRKKQKTAHLPGFRKGKAPLSHIRSIYQEEVRRDTALHLINKFYSTALEKENLRPAGDPKIELKSDITEDREFGFSVTMEIHPEILVDKNFKVRLSKPDILIEDKQVDQFLENLRHSVAKQEAVKKEKGGWDEELLKKFKCKNIQEMKTAVRTLLEHEKQTEARDKMQESALKQLVEKHPIPFLPESMVEEQKQIIVSSVTDKLKSAGMKEADREKYKTKHQQDFQQQARFMVQSYYLIYALANKWNISANQNEIEACLQMADRGAGPEEYQRAKSFLIREKTLDRLINTALPG